MPVTSPVIEKTHQAFSGNAYTRRIGPALAVLLVSFFIFVVIAILLGRSPFANIQSRLLRILLYLSCYSPAWLTMVASVHRYIRRRKSAAQVQIMQSTAVPLLPEQVDLLSKTAGGHGHFAGLASRFIALMIDLTIFSLTSILVQVFINISEPVLGIMNTLKMIVQYLGVDPRIITFSKVTANMVFFFVYFVLQWSFFGKTIGKAIMGLKIVTRHGTPPAPWQAVMRMFGYFISSVTLLVGFLWAGIDRKHQAWHDILADTYVIYDWDAQPDGWFLMQVIQKRQTQLENKVQRGKKSVSG